MDKKHLVFFDAECLVCNRFGRFILRFNKDIFLAPIGGSTYKSRQLPANIEVVDSIVYWNGEKAFIRTEALQQIGQHMGGIWKILALVSRIVPRSILNFFYDQFARIRYRVFGKIESCALIPKEYRPRILKD